MRISFVEKPKLNAAALTSLRKAVGWEGDLERVQKTIGRSYYWVAGFAEEKLIAYVEVISDGLDDAYIRNLIVHPDYQRRGIGRKLLEMVLSRVKADRIKTVNVLFEPGLEPFYRKAGFKIISGGLIDNHAEKG